MLVAGGRVKFEGWIARGKVVSDRDGVEGIVAARVRVKRWYWIRAVQMAL